MSFSRGPSLCAVYYLGPLLSDRACSYLDPAVTGLAIVPMHCVVTAASFLIIIHEHNARSRNRVQWLQYAYNRPTANCAFARITHRSAGREIELDSISTNKLHFIIDFICIPISKLFGCVLHEYTPRPEKDGTAILLSATSSNANRFS